MFKPDYNLPGDLSLLWQSDEGTWLITTNWIFANGRFECVDVQIRSERRPDEAPDGPLHALRSWDADPPPPSVNSKSWRSIPIPSIVRDFRAYLVDVDNPKPDLTGLTQEAIQRQRQQRAEALDQIGGNNALKVSVYKVVAEVYGQAIRDGRHPRQAVAEYFDISESGAAKRIGRSREKGYLPPTTKGRPYAGDGDTR